MHPSEKLPAMHWIDALLMMRERILVVVQRISDLNKRDREKAVQQKAGPLHGFHFANDILSTNKC